MLCFSVSQPDHAEAAADPRQVDSKDSLENIESKWVGEIAENCAGVKLVLVALKCDLREKHSDDDDEGAGGTRREEKDMIDYQQGLEVARRIQALRYLGASAVCRGCRADSRRMLCDAQSRRERGQCLYSFSAAWSDSCRHSPRRRAWPSPSRAARAGARTATRAAARSCDGAEESDSGRRLDL